MGHALDRASGTRCLLVFLVVTAGAGGLTAGLLPDVLGLGRAIRSGTVAGSPFDRVLVQVCEAAVVGCTLWLWLATAVVAGGAASGRRTGHPRVPRAMSRMVLAACGVALVGGLGAPAHAGDGSGRSRLDGLPLPDRATTTTQVSRVFARAASHHERAEPPGRRPPGVVVVRPGDTLWAIARAGLPPSRGDDEVAARVAKIHQANRTVIGPDPDLIRPGQRLRMPPATTLREEHR
jgi:hypothetical protein